MQKTKEDALLLKVQELNLQLEELLEFKLNKEKLEKEHAVTVAELDLVQQKVRDEIAKSELEHKQIDDEKKKNYREYLDEIIQTDQDLDSVC